MRYFKWPLLISLVCILTSFLWGGLTALTLTLILAALEVSLSFDNAIVNASILQKMNKVWQERFLTWGLFVAVFVVRLILPVMIVSLVASLNPLNVIVLAIKAPNEYAEHLTQAHISISAFGGLFLLLVFLSFLFNQYRETHWLGIIEKKLNQIGKFGSIEVLIALVVLLGAQHFVVDLQKTQAMVAGISGIILYIFINSLTNLLCNNPTLKLVKHASMMNFVYLEILDTSFSLDGIIGAFAITKDIIIILLGLTIGAVFVRSLTLFVTHKNILKKYRFLEHGAHYAVGALGLLMLISMAVPIPELIAGLIGISFIGLAFLSSLWQNIKR